MSVSTRTGSALARISWAELRHRRSMPHSRSRELQCLNQAACRFSCLAVVSVLLVCLEEEESLKQPILKPKCRNIRTFILSFGGSHEFSAGGSVGLPFEKMVSRRRLYSSNRRSERHARRTVAPRAQ